MGPLVDRTGEHLVSSDRAVFVAGRLLIQAVKTVHTGGDPPGIQPSYYSLRAFEDLSENLLRPASIAATGHSAGDQGNGEVCEGSWDDWPTGSDKLE